MSKMIFLLAAIFCLAASPAAAMQRTLLFIPQDDRPVSFAQTADTVRRLGYETLTPPRHLLGNRENLGKPDALWSWLYAHAKKADAVVLSSDALLYGSLVASRKHDFSPEEIERRTQNFLRLRRENPRLKIYVFGSVMRTPRSGAASGTEEPSYYARYGADIFRMTALIDKEETDGLTHDEERELEKLRKAVPAEVLADWMERRMKNFRASLRLVDMVRNERFGYLALGLDDNAPYSQTNKESRMLNAQSGDLGVSRFQTLSGIDEMGLVLLTRAINDMEWKIPLVAVQYADGAGGATVPSYSNETIDSAIRSHLFAAGAVPVLSPKRADLVLLVNTNEDGSTLEANDACNTQEPRENTRSFAAMVEKSLASRGNVSVADIAFANGADNALMKVMNEKKLLARLTSYSGWNTANNSAGFAIGQGILGSRMEDADRRALLAVRYLDDWAYQANIRQAVAGDRAAMRGGAYGKLDKAKKRVVFSTREQMYAFIRRDLSDFAIRQLEVDFPWNRMFEVDIKAS